jgi:hypothetical protein
VHRVAVKANTMMLIHEVKSGKEMCPTLDVIATIRSTTVIADIPIFVLIV